MMLFRRLLASLLFIQALTISTVFASAFNQSTFESELDHQADSYGFANPTQPTVLGSSVLVIYLHGFDHDFTEPFVGTPADKSKEGSKPKPSLAEKLQKQFPGLTILSVNYGKAPSWGKQAARIDITRNIREFLKGHEPFDKLVLMGSNMGGTTAINYLACCPADIKEKVVGVVAASAVSDLRALYAQAAGADVKPTLEKAFGGKPTDKAVAPDYFNNSLEANWPMFPTEVKVAVLTAQQDTVSPTGLQESLIKGLRNRDVEVKQFEVPGEGAAITPQMFVDGLKYVLK